MDNKPLKVGLIILGIFVAIYALNYFGAFKGFGLEPFVVMKPTDCPATDQTCHKTGGFYTCNAEQCLIKGFIQCNSHRQDSYVKLRTNADSYADFGSNPSTWIALDGVPGTGNSWIKTPGQLHAYCYKDGTVGGLGSLNNFDVTPHGNRLFSWSGDLVVEYTRPGMGTSWKAYTTQYCSAADLNPYHDDKYHVTDPEQENDAGPVNQYYCPATLTLKDSAGNTKSGSQNFEWSATTQGNVTSDLVVMLKGDTAKLDSALATDIIIYYGEQRSYEPCSGALTKCNAAGNGFYNCTGGTNNEVIFSKQTYCDANTVCEYGQCVSPFKVKEVLLVDTYGNSKPGFTPSDIIGVKLKLVSDTVSTGVVKVLVFKEGGTLPIEEKTLSPYNFKSTDYIPITITNPKALDKYYLKVMLTYNGKDVWLNGGEKFEFRVVTPMTCTVYIKSKDGGLSKIYAGTPALIEINSFSPDNPEAELGTISIKQKGVVVPTAWSDQIGKPVVQTEPSTGLKFVTYTFEKTFIDSGQVDVAATVSRGGGISPECTLSRDIESLTLSATDPFAKMGACAPYQQTVTMSFEVKDSLGNYVDTTNTGTVTDPTGTKAAITIGGSNGRYSITYNFNKLGGYTFDIQGEAKAYKMQFKPFTGILTSKVGCTPKECVVNGDCITKGANYICNTSGQCVQNNPIPWLTYFIIVLVAGIIITVIVFVVIYMKRNTASSDEGMGGMF